MPKLDVFIDGACEPINPGGHGAWAWVAVRDYAIASHTITQSGYIGHGERISSNVSEYYALAKFLKWFYKEAFDQATVYSDSQMLVNQMTGQWKVHDGLYRPYFDACWALHQCLTDRCCGAQIRFVWIPREGNEVADGLAHEVLRKRKPII